jgi:DNA invertase Pin-like site-specific DNA recombinase
MSMIGYARVSTEEQSLALQLDALRAAGCSELFEDHGVSGTSTQRQGLWTALATCEPGDVLVAWKLDRLGRSQLDLVNLVEDLKRRSVGLKVLTGEGAAIDTTQPHGRLIFGVFAAMSEFERELIRERTAAGMKAAKRRGRHVGRPARMTAERVAAARQLMAGPPERTAKEVAAALNVGYSTLRRALKAAAEV